MKSKSSLICRPLAHRATSRPVLYRGGFTFLEILFSVMILGIGFILVAAMFPAGLRQTQANLEDQEFTSISRYALRSLGSLARQVDPTTSVPVNKGRSLLDEYMRPGATFNAMGAPAPQRYPRVYSFHDPRMPLASAAAPGYGPDELWKAVAGNLIVPSDPRYAFVGMFSRDYANSNVDPLDPINNNPFLPTATVYLIPVRCRTKPQYSSDSNDPNCDLNMTGGASSNLEPTLVEMTMDFTVTPPQFIVKGICSRSGQTNVPVPKGYSPDINPVSDGAWVIVSDDRSSVAPSVPAIPLENLNGRIFRIGAVVPNTNGTTWTVAPDPQNSPLPASKQYTKVFSFVVGRGADPDSTVAKSNSTPPQLAGSTQDLGIQTTVITFGN